MHVVMDACMCVSPRESLLLILLFPYPPAPTLSLSHHQLRHRHYCPPPESLVQHTRIKQYATRFPTTTTCLHTPQLAKQCQPYPKPQNSLNSNNTSKSSHLQHSPCKPTLQTPETPPGSQPRVPKLSKSYPDDDDDAL